MFTSVCTERLFTHNGSNTRLQTVSQLSKAIETQRRMAETLGFSLKQRIVSVSETSHRSSGFAAVLLTHDIHNTQDVPVTDKIEKDESMSFSSRFTILATADVQHTELCTTEYVRNRMNVIHDSPGLLSDQVVHWIKVVEDIKLEIIDANLLEILKTAEKFAYIGDLNESLAAKVNNLAAVEPVQDGLSKEVAAAHQTWRCWRKSSGWKNVAPPPWIAGSTIASRSHT